jgi:hypothetical protein
MVRRLQGLTKEARADLSSPTPEMATIRALEQQSLQQLCEAEGLSPEAIEWLAVSYGVEALLSSAATEHLREERDQVWGQEFHEIIGGTDRLPAAFAARLQSKPRLGCEVVQLEQDPSHRCAAAIYRRHGAGNALQRAEGDFVLCTLPVPGLGRLQIAPPLSGAKQRAIRELRYNSATKVLAVANRCFWETDDRLFGGGIYTDLSTGVTFYPSDNATGKDLRISAAAGDILASYTWGQAARRLAALPHTARRQPGHEIPVRRPSVAHAKGHPPPHRELDLGYLSLERGRLRLVHPGPAHGLTPTPCRPERSSLLRGLAAAPRRGSHKSNLPPVIDFNSLTDLAGRLMIARHSGGVRWRVISARVETPLP